MELRGVLAEDVNAVWGEVSPLVVAAISRSPRVVDESDILSAIMSRDMQLWVAEDSQDIKAVCVTQIIQWPRRKGAVLYLCAGKGMAEWIDFLPVIESWAIFNGCDFIEASGRAGWEKVLKSWKKSSVTFEKELGHA